MPLCLTLGSLILATFAGTEVLCAQLTNEEAVLKARGKSAGRVIEKAYGILSAATVFTSCAVAPEGFSTSSCWALTVVVRYDPQAEQFLTSLYRSSDNLEKKLYGIVGLMALNPKSKERFAVEGFPSQLRAQIVRVQNGCVQEPVTFEAALQFALQAGPGFYLCKTLPSIYQTFDVKRDDLLWDHSVTANIQVKILDAETGNPIPEGRLRDTSTNIPGLDVPPPTDSPSAFNIQCLAKTSGTWALLETNSLTSLLVVEAPGYVSAPVQLSDCGLVQLPAEPPYVIQCEARLEREKSQNASLNTKHQ